jgi:type IV secretion system protein VirB1
MAVPREVMQHVVRVESSYNPYAIGVVGGRLVRQPQNLAEALSTARMLESRGYNFSVGIAQVNRYNLGKYGLTSYAQAFEVCPNLQAGSRILAECYQRHRDWGKSFSCYYSGNPVTGFRHGYVQKVFASIAKAQATASAAGADATGIQVVATPSRRAVPVEHFPLRADPRIDATTSRATQLDPTARPASDPALVGGAPLREMAVPATPVAEAAGPAVLAPVMPGPVRLRSNAAPAPSPPAPVVPAVGGDGAFVF